MNLPRMLQSIRQWLAILPLAWSSNFARAEPVFSDVFISGHEGYPIFRIPSVVVTRRGTVLAFAEGRSSRADQAHNDLVVKRSVDGGATWSGLRVVHEDGAHSLNNPTVVVEQQSGRVFLMYQRIPAHLKERSPETGTGYEGTNIYRNLLTWSDDDGVSWSRPLDVTRSTKRPARATTIASGPGIGIQLTRGPRRGRLILPFNEGPYFQWNNYAVFSDDRGASWGWGENVPGAFVDLPGAGVRSQINEAQMVELSDGSVRLNSRPFAGASVRKTSLSRDGGVTWSPVEDVPELSDPSCNAGVLRYSFDDARGQGRILFSGPEGSRRERGTVHVSYDDGATWPVKRLLRAGDFAYSALTRLPDGTAGCLFETDNYGRIVLARFSMAWLEASTAGQPPPAQTGSAP